MAKSLTDEQCQRIVDELNKKDTLLKWRVYNPDEIKIDSAFVALVVRRTLDRVWKHKYHLGKCNRCRGDDSVITIGNAFGFDVGAIAYAYIDLPDIDIGSHLM